MGNANIAHLANLPTGLYILLPLISFFFKWRQFISESTGPNFAIFVPNDRYLFEYDRSGPLFWFLKARCHGNQLMTLVSQFTRVADTPNRRSLRSASTTQLDVPSIRLSTVGSRAFSVAGASVWNNLPVNITSALSLPTFRHHLKTYLFSRCYNTVWHWLCSGPCGGVCCFSHFKNTCDDDLSLPIFISLLLLFTCVNKLMLYLSINDKRHKQPPGKNHTIHIHNAW